MTATEVLDREYLTVRAKVLEIGAALDRIDRAEPPIGNDTRLDKLHAGLKVLLEDSSERAEEIQMIFSRDYDPEWREQFDLACRK